MYLSFIQSLSSSVSSLSRIKINARISTHLSNTITFIGFKHEMNTVCRIYLVFWIKYMDRKAAATEIQRKGQKQNKTKYGISRDYDIVVASAPQRQFCLLCLWRMLFNLNIFTTLQ